MKQVLGYSCLRSNTTRKDRIMADSQFKIENKEDATQADIVGLTWEEATEHLTASPDADIDYALASMSHQRHYTFHNEAGQIVRLIREA